MSDDYRSKVKLEAATSRWEAAQLQAANAQRELDYAIAIFEKHKDELEQAQIEATEAQIEAQKQIIKDSLMKGHQAFVEASVKHGGKVA
jgi:uncharacterized protein YfaP (DUF2135 family)